MARTDAATVTADPVEPAVIPSASSPSVSPSQLAEATTWTTRTPRRAGRLSFLEDAEVAEAAEVAPDAEDREGDMDNTVPGGDGEDV
ncbi:hypothetical protein GCM10022233_20580 [Streptomyces shaanxiensis]|uniref:Uncharacterized protein n=1 Tax=Streptomyces shaanxiensis TaxID=653357 RepID=A0ABP7UQM8_9ACTN